MDTLTLNTLAALAERNVTGDDVAPWYQQAARDLAAGERGAE